MRPLSAQAKEYCKKGHDNERPFLKQFAAHCKDDKINTCGYRVIAIHEAPVVESINLNSVMDLSDAELVYNWFNSKDHNVILVEIKS